jgi:hypothetical protein
MQEPQPHGGDCGVSIEIKLKFIKISVGKNINRLRGNAQLGLQISVLYKRLFSIYT